MGTTIFKEEIDNEMSSATVSQEAVTATHQAIEVPAKQSELSSAVTVVLSVLTILLTLRYIVWRVSVNSWHLWWLSLPLLAAELFTAMHILGYQYTIWPRTAPALSPTQDPSSLPIFMFIPTVNEGDDVLGKTISGALATRDNLLTHYPNAKVRVIVCNDGFVANVTNWQSVESLASSLGAECVTRRVHGGAKAGNIEHARQLVGATGDSLLVVLDADQVAEPEFLIRTIQHFADPEIGWVQTRQFYRNCDSRVSRWAENQATLFYDLVCPGKSTINASYICGTNVVIRAKVLDQIGGFPTESVTEDFAASIRTHQLWRSIYIKDALAKGLGPMDLTGYFVQQSRWSRGTIGVLRSDWKLLFLPQKNGLTAAQRIQYFLSGTHYLCGLRDLVFLSTALVSLYLSRSPIVPVSIPTIAYYLLPYILASQALILIQSKSPSAITGMVIGYISFPTLVWSTVEALVNKKMRFKVTPKSASMQSDLQAVIPQVAIALLCVVVIIHALINKEELTKTNIIPMFWVTYAFCLLIPTFVLAKLRPTSK
jgi:cellulose synthase (UDP-forming)